MKTCTQILDSGFRGKINVVSPGDSAKLASPGKPCKREVKYGNLGRASPTKRAGPPPCKHPLRWILDPVIVNANGMHVSVREDSRTHYVASVSKKSSNQHENVTSKPYRAPSCTRFSMLMKTS